MNLSEIDIQVALDELLASGKAEYPEDHKAGMRVPKGGSNCTKCEYVSRDKKKCHNPYFQAWLGTSTLPDPADVYCCDWFESNSIQANYALEGRTEFRGLNISIENDKGSTRSGVGKDGKPWSTTMTYPYGYIRMTEGVDGDHVDCFLGPDEDAENVYVVHTKEPTTGEYDEDKCMLGFESGLAAKKAFLENYSNPDFFGSMSTIPFEKFKVQVLKTKSAPKALEAGGPGSGCNPEVAEPRCGRPSGADAQQNQDMAQAMVHWQQNVTQIKTAANYLITGGTFGGDMAPEAIKDAELLLNAVRNGEDFDRPLYRGISLRDMSSPILRLKQGDHFQIADIASFSQNQQVGKNFSIGPKQGDIHVVFQTDGVTRGVSTFKYNPHPERIGMQDESEVISNGRFEVTGVEDQKSYYGPNVYHTIHIKQLGTF